MIIFFNCISLDRVLRYFAYFRKKERKKERRKERILKNFIGTSKCVFKGDHVYRSKFEDVGFN